MIDKIGHLLAEVKTLQSENESLKSKAAKEALGDVMDQVTEIKGVKVLAARADGVDMNGLRELGDQLKEKLGEGVIVLASENEGKVNLIAMATDTAMKQGAHAGNLIKSIAAKVGGGGGGPSEYGTGWWKKSGWYRRCHCRSKNCDREPVSLKGCS